jgi:hypothetical protein
MAVFISYRRDDSDGEARAIYNRLAQETDAENLFLDVEAIGAGEKWKDRIDDMLKGIRAVLVVIGPHWLDLLNARSGTGTFDAVRMEIAASIEKPGVHVFPVLVKGASLPASSALPEDLRGLTDLNAIEVHNSSWSSDIQRLVAALRKVGALPTSRRRWIIRAATAAGIVAVVALLAIVAPRIVAVPKIPDDMARRYARQLIESRGLKFHEEIEQTPQIAAGMELAVGQDPPAGSYRFQGQTVEVKFRRNEVYHLVCRAGGAFDAGPAGDLFRFEKYNEKASATMRPGTCAWMDRAMNGNEADLIRPLGFADEVQTRFEHAPGGLLVFCAKSQYTRGGSPEIAVVNVEEFMRLGNRGELVQKLADVLCADRSQ